MADEEVKAAPAKVRPSENCNVCHECIVTYRHKKKLRVCDDCYRKSVVDRLAARKICRTLHEGCLILYYMDGWRVGYLCKLGVAAASVQPLGGQCGAVPEVMRVPLTDIKPEIVTSGKVPATVGEYYEMSKKKVLLVADRSVPKTEYPQMTPAVHAILEPAKVKRQSVNLDSEPCGPVDTSFDVQKMNTEEPVTEAPCTGVLVTETVAKSRTKHAPVDLIRAQTMYEQGLSINAVVEAVKGTRAAFDVKKLVRKTFKEAGILKD